MEEISKKIQELLPKLNEYFISKSEILIVYLFGSILDDTFNSNSDIDIAIKYTDDMIYNDIISIEIEVQKKLYELLKKQNIKIEIDVVSMNEVGGIFNLEILNTGKLLYEKSEDYTRNYVCYIEKIYIDEKFKKDYENKQFIKNLKERYKG